MRPEDHRMLCGVCRGVAIHLGVPTKIVRLCFLIATLLAGAGAAAYVFLWVFVPAGNPIAAMQAQQYPAYEAPLSHGNVNTGTGTAVPNAMSNASTNPDTGSNTGPGSSPTPGTDAATTPNPFEELGETIRRASKPSLFALIGLLAIGLAAIFAISPLPTRLIVPALIAVAGIAMAWFRFGGEEGNLKGMVAGVALVLMAYVCFVVVNVPSFRHSPIHIIASGIALLVCVVIVVVPWFSKLIASLGAERAAKEREEERADMTAHLHDGVLQTLALIQLNSNDPQTVFTLARGQERDLRQWLYQEHTPPERSVSAGIKEIAAQIEDEHGKPIEVVTVGDAQPSSQTDALLSATRQALLNAVQHGGEPTSVYCEASDSKVEVFVRDHGEGFDVKAVPPDRLGIRESIVGRVKRRGGSVEIVSRTGWGTEVRMHMPIPITRPEAATTTTQTTKTTKTGATTQSARATKAQRTDSMNTAGNKESERDERTK